MMNDGSMIAYQLSFIFTLLLILKIEELSSDPGISLLLFGRLSLSELLPTRFYHHLKDQMQQPRYLEVHRQL